MQHRDPAWRLATAELAEDPQLGAQLDQPQSRGYGVSHTFIVMTLEQPNIVTERPVGECAPP